MLATYDMRRMRNNNLEIRIAASLVARYHHDHHLSRYFYQYHYYYVYTLSIQLVTSSR